MQQGSASAWTRPDDDGSLRAKGGFALSHRAVAARRCAPGILHLTKGKWDIPQYYGDGAMVGMDLGYLMMGKPLEPLILSMPPIRSCEARASHSGSLNSFRTARCVCASIEASGSTRADLVLGLCRVRDKSISDMVAVDRTAASESWSSNRRHEVKARMGIRSLDIEVHRVYARVSSDAQDRR